jgi:hypothetical protein
MHCVNKGGDVLKPKETLIDPFSGQPVRLNTGETWCKKCGHRARHKTDICSQCRNVVCARCKKGFCWKDYESEIHCTPCRAKVDREKKKAARECY